MIACKIKKTVSLAALLLTMAGAAVADGTGIRPIENAVQTQPDDYALFVTIKIKSGKANEYKKILLPYLKSVQREIGIRTYKVHQSVEDSSLFEVYAHFDSKTSHEAHLNQQHTKDYLANAKALFEEGYPSRRKFLEVR